jgi:hypothetical protein
MLATNLVTLNLVIHVPSPVESVCIQTFSCNFVSLCYFTVFFFWAISAKELLFMKGREHRNNEKNPTFNWISTFGSLKELRESNRASEWNK